LETTAIHGKLIVFNRSPVDDVKVGENGYMDILCIIPIDEIIPKGKILDERFGDQKSFWKYFTKTWLNTYDPRTQNINNILRRESPKEIMVNRTNIAIERLNRTFQSEFKNDGYPL